MKGRNIEGVSTAARPTGALPAWTGITVADAVFTKLSKIDHDAASAMETASTLAQTPVNEPLAIHFSGNWKSPSEPGTGYLALSGSDGSLKLVEWSGLDHQAKKAILAAVADRSIFTFDGSTVAGAFLDAGLLPPEKLICVKTMARLVENRAYPDPKDKSSVSFEPLDLLGRYGIAVAGGGTNPVILLPRLAAKLTGEIVRADLQKVLFLERQLVSATALMQRAGLGIDCQGMEAVLKNASEMANKAAVQVRALLDCPELNLNNSDELLKALNSAAIETESTKREELALIDHPVTQAIVRFKEANSVRNDAAKCLEAVGPDGRVRPQWDPLGAGTGRMSCSNPNLQSLKWDPDFRRCFIPAPGYVYFCCDYAQADLRTIAYKAQDAGLTEALAPGRDFHKLTAGKVLGKSPELITGNERELSKTLIYGISYIMSPASLAREARLKLGQEWTKADAREFIQRLFSAYPGLQTYYDQVREAAETATECRTLLYRRRRLLPSGPEHKMYRFRRMLNMAQGTVGDALKEAMIAISAQIGPAGAIVLNVHDELVLEVPETGAAEVAGMAQREMEKAFSQAIPGIPVQAEVYLVRSLGVD